MSEPATPRPRIVAVDDHENICALLEIGLTQADFDVRTASDAASALALVRSWEPHAILLDVMMPVMDGIKLIPLIRRHSHVPILMLTARCDVRDRIAGLQAGADDYILKPFEIEEVVVRLRGALRRPFLDDGQHLRFADLVLDLHARTARRGNRDIPLSKREFDVAATLLRRPRRVFTRDELLDLVWGNESEVSRNSVDTYVSYLRRKIDAPELPPLIHTIRGVGYSVRETYDRDSDVPQTREL